MELTISAQSQSLEVNANPKVSLLCASKQNSVHQPGQRIASHFECRFPAVGASGQGRTLMADKVLHRPLRHASAFQHGYYGISGRMEHLTLVGVAELLP